MYIKKDPDLVRSIDLPAKLKEFGFDVDVETIDHIPFGGFEKYNREGKFENGVMCHYYYFNVPFTVSHLQNLADCNIVARVKERGYDIKPEWIKWLPWKYTENPLHYYYDIDQVIAYITSVEHHNFKELLHERGYDIADKDISTVMSSSYEISTDVPPVFKGYSIDKAIAYLNTITNYNLLAVLKEHGYEVDTMFMNRMRDDARKHEYYSHDYGSSYDIEKVLAYLEEHPPRKIIKNMKDEITNVAHKTVKEDSYIGSIPSDFYVGAHNISVHFPIFKWYVEKYKTLADYMSLGYMNVEEILNQKDFKIRWTYKSFTKYKVDKQDYSNGVAVLRVFDAQHQCEYMLEALIEIEDGMFIMLTNGHYDIEEESMTAQCHLIYKEGIHDPADLLLFLSDKTVYHTEAGKLGLLYHDGSSFYTQDFTIPKPTIDFNLNYNEGFDKVHSDIVNALYENEGKGLVLLHGKPGTGKTTYIRYLINSLGKNKIFVPPNLAEVLSDPGFIPFLMDNPNSILFIEDAENVLRSREEKQHNQSVSNILNITDGLLSDCLNIQVVATFNTKIKNIDPALLRKGRLIANYEFTDLQADRAEKLADSLKVWLDDTENHTLADIYAAKKKNVS